MKLFLFDKDATLTETRSGNVCPNKTEDQMLLPNVVQKMAEIRSQGHKIGMITNQGGVSNGYMSEKEAWWIIGSCNLMLGNVFENFQVNFHHRNGKFKDRYVDKAKPKPDMIFHALEDFKSKGIEFEKIIFVGDGFSDKNCATNYNLSEKENLVPCEFIFSHVFFNWPQEHMEKNDFGWRLKREYVNSLMVNLERFTE